MKIYEKNIMIDKEKELKTWICPNCECKYKKHTEYDIYFECGTRLFDVIENEEKYSIIDLSPICKYQGNLIFQLEKTTMQ